MDFFDEIGKKINDAADVIVSKTKSIKATTLNQTKSISDITKLKSKKREIEKNLTSYYYQLGKAYYENSGENCDYIYSELVSVIDSENLKLKGVISELELLDGSLRCKSCGAKIPADSVFCNICGTKVEKRTESVQPENINTEEVHEAEIVETPVVCESAARICKDCGSAIPDEAIFCTHCGKKYEE